MGKQYGSPYLRVIVMVVESCFLIIVAGTVYLILVKWANINTFDGGIIPLLLFPHVCVSPEVLVRNILAQFQHYYLGRITFVDRISSSPRTHIYELEALGYSYSEYCWDARRLFGSYSVPMPNYHRSLPRLGLRPQTWYQIGKSARQT